MSAKWKGSIAFGLVTIPVILQPSRDKEANISFHQIDSRDNARIKYKRVNSVTGKEVPWEKIIKGYQYDRDTTVPVPNDILERINGESAKTIAIETFIDKKELDAITIEKIYFLTPDKKGEKGYVILREALKDTDKIAIAKVVITTKEYIAAVLTYGENGLILCLLSYYKEMHDITDIEFPNKSLSSYKINKKEIEIAKKLIDSMTSKWHPEKYVDEYQAVIHKWVEDEVNNKPHTTKRKKKSTSTNVTNLIDLLRKSIVNKKSKSADISSSKRTKQLTARKKLQHRHTYTTRH